MILLADYLVPAVWLIGLVYWIAAARGAKKTRLAAPAPQQIPHHLLGLLSGLLFCVPFRGTFLHRFLIPRSDGSAVIGLAVLVAGMGFAFWARASLGRNWSAVVTLKEDHRLIRTGPYAIVRHPIYTGLLTAVLGSAVALGRVHHFVALALVFAAYWRKSRIEERWLAQEFSAEYETYRREVPALIPFLF